MSRCDSSWIRIPCREGVILRRSEEGRPYLHRPVGEDDLNDGIEDRIEADNVGCGCAGSAVDAEYGA